MQYTVHLLAILLFYAEFEEEAFCLRITSYGSVHNVTESILARCSTEYIFSLAHLHLHIKECLERNLYFVISFKHVQPQYTPKPFYALYPPLFGKIWCTGKTPMTRFWILKTLQRFSINATVLYFNLPMLTSWCSATKVSVTQVYNSLTHVWCGHKLPWSFVSDPQNNTISIK